MRSVMLAVCTLGLSGCATVSMVPGDATVEANLTKNQSALRAASDSYCDALHEAGWVESGGGLFGLARMLMHGESKDDKAAAGDYASRIGVETEPADIVFNRISADAAAAREGLVSVVSEAQAVLNEDSDATRGDVKSFERSLVTAHKAHRNFANAADLAARRFGDAPASLDQALERLAREIDVSRQIADELADRYASIGGTLS